MTAMNALEELSRCRDVEPPDDQVVATAVATIVDAARRDRRGGGQPGQRLRRRVSGAPRLVAVVGGFAAATVIGGGIAAATGLFDGPPQPLRTALAFMSSPDPSAVPGATVRISVAGPEGTTFRLVTGNFASGGRVDECVALGIETADGHHEAGHGGCSLLSVSPGTPAPVIRQLTPSIQLEIWRAPSGASYYLVFGQGSARIATVSLRNIHGRAMATETASPDGYVIYVPADRLVGYAYLTFTDTSGAVLYSQDVNAGPRHG
jgi:hypothetical protein